MLVSGSQQLPGSKYIVAIGNEIMDVDTKISRSLRVSHTESEFLCFRDLNVTNRNTQNANFSG